MGWKDLGHKTKGAIIGSIIALFISIISLGELIRYHIVTYNATFLDLIIQENYILQFLGIIILFSIIGVIISTIYRRIRIKETSTWIKGGWIGLLVIFFGFWIFNLVAMCYTFNRCGCSAIVGSTGCSYIEFFIWPIHWISIIILSLGSFIIGVLIGYIYGKIKKSRQNA